MGGRAQAVVVVLVLGRAWHVYQAYFSQRRLEGSRFGTRLMTSRH
jgi:hypothetical protein